MSRDSTGITLIGGILDLLAKTDGRTVAVLARDLGAARSTTFAILRDLEEAGLVVRDANGLVSPGETASALGYATFDLGRLAGAALALLPLLRDETDGAVELAVRLGQQDCVLARRVPVNMRHAKLTQPCALFRHEIVGGSHTAELRLRLHEPLSEAERDRAQQALAAVAGALSDTLRSHPAREQA